MSSGWGRDGNALPIGTEAPARGVGRRASPEKPGEGGEMRRAPRRAGVGAAESGPLRASEEPAARGCLALLPRPAHKGAQRPRFLLAPLSRPGLWGSAPVTASGRVSGPRLLRASSGPAVRTRPAAREDLSRQGHGQRPAPRSLRRPSAADRTGERGGGRPAAAEATPGELTSFISHPPPTPPSAHPEGFP